VRFGVARLEPPRALLPSDALIEFIWKTSVIATQRWLCGVLPLASPMAGCGRFFAFAIESESCH